MATYVPTDGVVTVYVGNAHFGNATTTIKSITDGDNTDDKFTTTGETLTLTVDNNGTESMSSGWKYLGTTTAINGGPYIVIEQTFGGVKFTYVIGTGATGTSGMVPSGGKEVPATVSDLNINTATFTVCFFPGTLIATPSGERRVEELVPGDPVLVKGAEAVPASWTGRVMRRFRLRQGFERSVPVKWLGRQTVSTRFGPADRLMPVRFAAGSLGGGGATLCRIAT